MLHHQNQFISTVQQAAVQSQLQTRRRNLTHRSHSCSRCYRRKTSAQSVEMLKNQWRKNQKPSDDHHRSSSSSSSNNNLLVDADHNHSKGPGCKNCLKEIAPQHSRKMNRCDSATRYHSHLYHSLNQLYITASREGNHNNQLAALTIRTPRT